jgi:hypothetical protein
MKTKKLGLIASITLIAASAAAQTNTFPPSGNVGIGTTSSLMSKAAEGKLCTQTPFRYLR